MSVPSRYLLRLLRLPALALLVLVVLANPVLAAVGDLHDAVRGDTAHLHADGVEAAAEQAEAGDGASGIDLLHALTDGAHCCGHLTALPSSYVMPPLLQTAARAPDAMRRLAPSVRPASLIRPPIAG
jgi:hypothetical protein